MLQLYIRRGATVIATVVLVLAFVTPAAAAPPPAEAEVGFGAWLGNAVAGLWSPLTRLVTGVDAAGERREHNRPLPRQRVVAPEEGTVGPDWDPDG